MYEVNGWFKDAEEDVFAEGCIPPGTTFGGPERWSAEGITELVEDLMSFAGCDDPNSVGIWEDESGRIDIQVTETAESMQPSDSQIEAWKRGEFRLWASTYTFQIEQVQREPVDLRGMIPGAELL